MYSSDRMKRFKDYDKNVIYLIEKKGDSFDFLPSFC